MRSGSVMVLAVQGLNSDQGNTGFWGVLRLVASGAMGGHSQFSVLRVPSPSSLSPVFPCSISRGAIRDGWGGGGGGGASWAGMRGHPQGPSSIQTGQGQSSTAWRPLWPQVLPESLQGISRDWSEHRNQSSSLGSTGTELGPGWGPPVWEGSPPALRDTHSPRV